MVTTTADDSRPSTPSRDAFIQSIRDQNALRTAELVERTRRKAVGGRTRQRFFDDLAAKDGVDLSILSRLHDRDWQTMLRESKKLERTAVANLRKERDRQREARRGIMKHRARYEYKKGNPQTSICLWQAVAAPNTVINVQTFSDGVATLDSQITSNAFRSGENLVRFAAHAEGNPPQGFKFDPVAAMEILTEHVFEGTVPHEGVLSVMSEYAPLGTCFLGAPGFCMEPDGSAGIDVVAYQRIEVETGGERIDLPIGETKVITDASVRPTCDGESRVLSIATTGGVAYQLTHGDVISVEPGDIVRVTAGYSVYIAGACRGVSRVDFNSIPSFGLNVPMVLLKIAG